MAFHMATGLPVLRAKEFIKTHPADLIGRILGAALNRMHLPDVNSLAKVNSNLRDRIFCAAEVCQAEPYLKDPIEQDPDVGPIIQRVLDEMTELVKGEATGKRLGSCHRLWKLTKERLFKKHGITWYSPAEMNPGSCFD